MITEKEILDLFSKIDSTTSQETKLKFIENYRFLMMEYECALKEITTKFNVLNDEFSSSRGRNPIESIKTRIKTPESIFEKMVRKNINPTLKSIKENIFDIAGVRIICSYKEDIYFLADTILKQDDIKLYEKKDYIKNPKENGYRSLHLIVEIPIFLSTHKEFMKCEIQLRTIAMDFWASLEHKLKYKKDLKDSGIIVEKLKRVAEEIALLDDEMEQIHKTIDGDDIA